MAATMQRAIALLLVSSLASLALAGCVGSEPASIDAADDGSSDVEIDANRPDPTFTQVDAGEAAAPDANATLAAPPQLQVGEWWTISMESPLDGRTATYTRVMAEISDEGYVFGMPHEGWYKEAVVYHVPFFGDVNPDLSGHAHDIPFVPLKFPLTDGQTWETHWESQNQPLTATVDADEATNRATVTFTQPNGNVLISLVYDATLHEIVEFTESTISYRVTAHGYDFKGWVTVPRGEDLIFFHGRIGGALGITPGGLAPAPLPSDEVDVIGGYNRMSFILMRGDIGLTSAFGGSAVPPMAPGVYGIKATDPDGVVYELAPEPMVDGLQVEFFESTSGDGQWLLEYTNTGPGATFMEGIAYHQYDIKIPTGEKRSDHSHEVVR